MAELPASVAVVTARSGDEPRGLVVTSLTGYTDDPPSVLVSVAHASRSHDALAGAEHFGAHVLHVGQEPLAARFAGRGDDKFADLEWGWDGDVPRLDGALAYLRCRRSASFTHLDHTVVIGLIEAHERQTSAEPMVYLRRAFAWRVTG